MLLKQPLFWGISVDVTGAADSEPRDRVNLAIASLFTSSLCTLMQLAEEALEQQHQQPQQQQQEEGEAAGAQAPPESQSGEAPPLCPADATVQGQAGTLADGAGGLPAAGGSCGAEAGAGLSEVGSWSCCRLYRDRWGNARGRGRCGISHGSCMLMRPGRGRGVGVWDSSDEAGSGLQGLRVRRAGGPHAQQAAWAV